MLVALEVEMEKERAWRRRSAGGIRGEGWD
jgi:hypothetical protein